MTDSTPTAGTSSMHGNRDTPRTVYRGTGFYVSVVAILLTAAVLLVLAAQNTQNVAVNFLSFDFVMPLFAVAIGSGLIAIILDELVGIAWRRQRRSRLEERAELERIRRAAGKG